MCVSIFLPTEHAGPPVRQNLIRIKNLLQIQLHPDEEPGDKDLLDFAAVHTVLNGGDVYAVEREQVPDQALITAVFRY